MTNIALWLECTLFSTCSFSFPLGVRANWVSLYILIRNLQGSHQLNKQLYMQAIAQRVLTSFIGVRHSKQQTVDGFHLSDRRLGPQVLSLPRHPSSPQQTPSACCRAQPDRPTHHPARHPLRFPNTDRAFLPARRGARLKFSSGLIGPLFRRVGSRPRIDRSPSAMVLTRCRWPMACSTMAASEEKPNS